MRREFWVLAVVGMTLLAASACFAQAKTGDKLISVGLGLGYPGIYGSSSIPPIFLAYEQCVYPKITVGGMATYSSSSYSSVHHVQGVTAKWSYSYIFLGGRGAYHFGADVLKDVKNVDLYGGITIGFNIVSHSYTGPSGGIVGYSAGGGYFHGGFFGGGRYFFSDRFGAMAELGYDIGYFKIGFTYKI